MLFFSYLQSLADRNASVTVELKNGLQLTGILQSVDQYLNIKLENISAEEPDKYPHFLAVRNCFVRGSVVRYIHLDPSDTDLTLLQDLCRKELQKEKPAAKL